MRIQRPGVLVLLTVAASLILANSSAADIGVSVVPPDGIALLGKKIQVQAGTTILGVEFETTAGAFPEVVLVRGAGTSLAEGTEIARSSAIVEASRGVNRLMFPEPIYVSDPGEYCVAVRIPSDPGAKMRAADVADLAGSYLVSGTSRSLTPVSVNWAISLITSSSAGNVSSKPLGEDTPALRTFLAVRKGNAGAVAVEFAVEQPGMVGIAIYDVSGHSVRDLVRETLVTGRYIREWDSRDGSGKMAAAGVYLIRLRTADRVLTQKLVMTK